MSFELRAARPEDCHIICELIAGLAQYEKLESECHADPALLYEELFGPRRILRCVIGWEKQAEEVEKPIAFALYFFNFSTFLTRRGLYLEDLFVVPEARRKGYGRQMMKWLAAEARREGCARFEWVVLDWNRSAIDFYRSLGAQLQNDWRICRVTGDALVTLAQTSTSKETR